MTASADLLTTPLNALHIELGARMVPFAGYSMPVQYPAGLVAEHHHTGAAAGVFGLQRLGRLGRAGVQPRVGDYGGLAALQLLDVGAVVAEVQHAGQRLYSRRVPVAVDGDRLGLSIDQAVTGAGASSTARLRQRIRRRFWR